MPSRRVPPTHAHTFNLLCIGLVWGAIGLVASLVVPDRLSELTQLLWWWAPALCVVVGGLGVLLETGFSSLRGGMPRVPRPRMRARAAQVSGALSGLAALAAVVCLVWGAADIPLQREAGDRARSGRALARLHIAQERYYKTHRVYSSNWARLIQLKPELRRERRARRLTQLETDGQTWYVRVGERQVSHSRGDPPPE